MDSKLATAFFLAPRWVYGYALKPFCLLHSLQLEALESPLFCGGIAKPHDILIAAQICSTYKVRTGYNRAFLRRILCCAVKEELKFLAYLVESRSLPELANVPSSGGGPLRAPWQLVVVTSLIRNTSLTWKQAWTMPEGQAMWLFYSIREQVSGKSEIYSEEEKREDAELLAKLEADKPVNDRRCHYIAEFERRQRDGTWPSDVPFDIDGELPREVSNV